MRRAKPERIQSRRPGSEEEEVQAGKARRRLEPEVGQETGVRVERAGRGGAQQLHTQTWPGKPASSRALGREELAQQIRRLQAAQRSRLEDVTGRYSKEEELVSCGICDQMDPPAEVVDKTDQTIEWIVDRMRLSPVVPQALH